MKTDSRVAIFVDGDNLSWEHGQEIREIGNSYGSIAISRVYGDAAQTKGWKDAAGYNLIHSGSGKNATDVLLSLDALELALMERFDICVVGSSDRDFRHLVCRLRERGISVIGVGSEQTKDTYQAQCCEFRTLAREADTKTSAARIDDIVGFVEGLLRSGEYSHQGMTLSALAKELSDRHGISKSDLPVKTWSKFLESMPDRFEILEPGPGAKVKLKAKDASEGSLTAA